MKLIPILQFIFLQLLIADIFASDSSTSSIMTEEDELQKVEKRLETVDGVEIASSYREYMDLALSDLEDRLAKSESKLRDFNGRIEKRDNLFEKIKLEIVRRKSVSAEFSRKEKDVRNRLIKNTAMKSAIQNLADIAGYKLSHENVHFNQKTLDSNAEINVTNLQDKVLNNTYIELAHYEISGLLSSEKQQLVTLVRDKMNNDHKLGQLEKLETSVESSLVRLKELVERLSELIEHDNDIRDILRRLQNQTRLDSNERKKILSIIDYYTKKRSSRSE